MAQYEDLNWYVKIFIFKTQNIHAINYYYIFIYLFKLSTAHELIKIMKSLEILQKEFFVNSILLAFGNATIQSLIDKKKQKSPSWSDSLKNSTKFNFKHESKILSLILFIPAGITIFFMFEPENASFSRSNRFDFFEKSTTFKDLQLANACSPILVTLFGMKTFSIDVKQKASSSILVSIDSFLNSTVFKFKQFLNENFPTITVVFGIVIHLRDVPENEKSPISFRLELTSKLTSARSVHE